jgi:hypothetical protein
MSEDAAQDKDPKTGRFLPGNSGFGGRPKGARNKLGEEFIQALHESFMEHGAETIETVRVEDPTQYVKVIASLLPKELNVKVSELDELSDEELSRRYDALTSALVAAGFGSGPGDATAQAAQPAEGLPTLQ